MTMIPDTTKMGHAASGVMWRRRLSQYPLPTGAGMEKQFFMDLLLANIFLLSCGAVAGAGAASSMRAGTISTR